LLSPKRRFALIFARERRIENFGLFCFENRSKNRLGPPHQIGKRIPDFAAPDDFADEHRSFTRFRMATALAWNAGSMSPRSQGTPLRVCAAPLRRTALTRMHGKNVIHVQMSPREENEYGGLENQLDSPGLVAWSVACDSPPPGIKLSTPAAPPSEPLVDSPSTSWYQQARRTLAPRRTLALCESGAALCQGSPPSLLSSPRSSARKANEPESPWRAAWTLTCETPPRIILPIDINLRKHSLVERFSPSAATMGGLEAADNWATRMQHGETTEGEPSSSSAAHSPSSHRSSTSCAGSPEHEHEHETEAEAAAPSKRRRRADRVGGAERMAERTDPTSTPSAWAVRHHPLRPPPALRSRRPSFDGDALVAPTLATSTPHLVPASAAESFSRDVMSTPTEESFFSLDVSSTPTFDAVFSDDVDVPPCNE
jgi:hypothetical protein